MKQLQSQARAKYAYECISFVLANKGLDQKSIRSYVQSLPAMIQTNGFGQALAFYLANKKSSGEYKKIYEWVQEWLRLQNIYPGDKLLMACIAEGSMHQYQLATAETQALLVWLKKFARAELESS